jgi:Phage protein (N4 Gp49/phage Sf6 gene 66) family/Protein of unknown function (DUF2829)
MAWTEAYCACRRSRFSQPPTTERHFPMDIEQQIVAAGANKAPRVTLAQIQNLIASEFYFTAADGVRGESHMGTSPAGRARSLDYLTFCVLVLRNGFTVTGESACASPENFNADIGKKVARENAIDKIWPLEGYLLRQMLHDATSGMSFGQAMERLKLGMTVARAGWNGKGMWLALQAPDANSKMTLPYFFLNYPADAQNTPGARVPWLPSQTDALAEDWHVVVA